MDRLATPALTVILMILLLLTPDEATLGGLIKAIYLHGAIATAGLILFAAAGLFGATGLWWRKRQLWLWSWVTKRMALGFWVTYLASSLMVAVLAWGGVLWSEPRLRAGIYILETAVAIYVAQALFKRWWVEPLANVATMIIVVVLRLQAGLLFHPASAVGSAEDPRLRWSYYAILTTTILISAELSRLAVKAAKIRGVTADGLKE